MRDADESIGPENGPILGPEREMVSQGPTNALNRRRTVSVPLSTPVFATKTRDGLVQNFKVTAQIVRNLTGFTGDFVSPVWGRFCGTAANVSVRQVVSFAPTSASGRTNEAFAAIFRAHSRRLAEARLQRKSRANPKAHRCQSASRNICLPPLSLAGCYSQQY
jgi:hypothetical protein